jgi:hypothetical protein
MATKTATRKTAGKAVALIEVNVIEARRTFGHSGHTVGQVVALTKTGDEYLDGIELARFGQSYREICGNCGGSGFLPFYAGIADGVCFPCMGAGTGKQIGSGTVEELTKVLVRRAKARARTAAKREEKFAAAKVAHVAWLAANPAVAEIAARFGSLTDCRCERAAADQWRECNEETCWERQREVRNTHDGVLLELAGYATCRIITDKQVDLLIRLVAEHAIKTAAREVKASAVAERKWLGAEGEKISATGTLGRPYHSESAWGTSTIYKLTTDDGNVVTWFRSGYHQFEAGVRVTMTGTVKKLAESEKYGKETVLTRCKLAGA